MGDPYFIDLCIRIWCSNDCYEPDGIVVGDNYLYEI
jgi:hypothetical protein